jgi:protein gp37
MPTWNPWHGCHKISPGCLNCYVFRIDEQHGRDSSIIAKTHDFDLPLRRNRQGQYKLVARETVYTCFSSDFFLPDADVWRAEVCSMIRHRQDLQFFIITKRIDRFQVGLPEDWGDGYDHVTIYSTVENQDRADYRLPILAGLPIKHKGIICEPLLELINLTPYLGQQIEGVVAGGESGPQARICDYAWIVDLHQQCQASQVPFHFKQTGYRFRKDGRIYLVKRQFQAEQAAKARLDYP